VLYVELDGKTRRMTRNTKCPDNQSLVLLGKGGGVVSNLAEEVAISSRVVVTMDKQPCPRFFLSPTKCMHNSPMCSPCSGNKAGVEKSVTCFERNSRL